jgi:2-keto-4-pentenoate hydratase/2-oxohepta-3-ene-1,7-dioic acid hydratase in catechol pathway
MKIICIGRNYAEHNQEMKAETPQEPVFFMKPETSLIKDNGPFYYPDFSTKIHYETEIVLRINKSGKNISREFAHKYYDELTVGIDFTARDLQEKCKAKGNPWEPAKAFDGAAPIGRFVSKTKFSNIRNLSFHLEINKKKVQEGNTSNLLFDYDVVIEHVSKFITLKTGDLLFTGTPVGVGPVKQGDILEGYIENEKYIECEIK